jgi:hypothetical protein
MKNINKMWALIALGLTFGVAASQAQQSNQGNPMANATADSAGSAMPESGGVAPAGQEACWKQAGISKNTMEQRKTIVSGAQARIRSVESDATLTAPQQKQQARQIRMTARQQLEKLITPEQQESLRQCRRERGEERHGAGASGSGNSPAPDANSTDSSQPK